MRSSLEHQDELFARAGKLEAACATEHGVIDGMGLPRVGSLVGLRWSGRGSGEFESPDFLWGDSSLAPLSESAVVAALDPGDDRQWLLLAAVHRCRSSTFICSSAMSNSIAALFPQARPGPST